MKHRIAEGLATQNFELAKESFDETQGVYTMYLESKDNVYRKVDNYDELHSELDKLRLKIIEKADKEFQEKKFEEREKQRKKPKIFKLFG